MSTKTKIIVGVIGVLSIGLGLLGNSSPTTPKTQEGIQAGQPTVEVTEIPNSKSTEISIPTVIVSTPTPTLIPTVVPTAVIYTPAPTVKPVEQTTTPVNNNGFSCNCAKTCPQMSSCSEAQYQLNSCGCSARDADDDGIACDAQCQ